MTAYRLSRYDQGAAPNGNGYFDGAKLLVSDTRVALLLLREARDQAAKRMFGVSRDESFLVTIIALGMLASAAQSRAERIGATFKGPNPSLGDAVVGTAMVKAAAHGVAGDWSKDAPLFSTLAVISVVGVVVRPVLRVSFRDVKAVSRRLRADFDHRYGHLVRSGRR